MNGLTKQEQAVKRSLMRANPCPKCGAGIGQPCRIYRGPLAGKNVPTTQHKERP
jgi:hypothetical protein